MEDLLELCWGQGNTIIKGNITIWPDKFLGFDLPGNEIKTPGLGSEKKA